LDEDVVTTLKHHIVDEKNVVKLYNALMEDPLLGWDLRVVFAKLVADKKRQIDVVKVLVSSAEKRGSLREATVRHV